MRTTRIGRPNAKRPAQNDVLILAKQQHIKQIWSCSGTGPQGSQILSTHFFKVAKLISNLSESPRLHVLIPWHAAYFSNLKVTNDGTQWALASKNTYHLNPLHYRLSILPQESPLVNHDCSEKKQRTSRAYNDLALLKSKKSKPSFLFFARTRIRLVFNFQNCHLGSCMCNTSFTIFVGQPFTLSKTTVYK